jgi:hypothetical protein
MPKAKQLLVTQEMVDATKPTRLPLTFQNPLNPTSEHLDLLWSAWPQPISMDDPKVDQVMSEVIATMQITLQKRYM